MPRTTRSTTAAAVVDPEPGQEVELAVFERPRGNRIAVRKGKGTNGKVYVDAREQFLNDDGEWTFTRKGVRFNAEEAATLATLLA